MIEAIVIAGLRATILAAPTALALSVFRVRDAAFRHACWRLVLIAMIAMPVLMAVLPAIELPFLPPAPAPPTDSTPVVFSPVASVPPEPSPLPIVPLAYSLVASALLARWGTGYLLGRRLIRQALPAEIDTAHLQPHVRCLTSDRVSVPVTFGWIRPAILLPPTFRRWPKRKLRTVLAHEAAHIRRHDFLTSSLAAFGKAIFWFHPLAWWLEWRLSTLAEQAADDAAAGTNPEAYAGVLVNIAQDARAGRVHGLAVAGRRGLEGRVTRLIDPDYTRVQTPRRRIVLMVAVLIVLSGLSASIVVTEANAPAQREVEEVETSAPEGEVVTSEFGGTARWFAPEQEGADSSPAPNASGGQAAGAEGNPPDSPEDPEAVKASESEETPIVRSRAFFFQLWDDVIAAGEQEALRLAAERLGSQLQETPETQPASPEPPAEEETPQPPSQESPEEERGEESERVFSLGNGVRPPTIRERVDPEYSEEARRARHQGTVVLDAIVRIDGNVEILAVTKGLGYGLDEAAIRALRQWKFNPGTRNGEPVDVRLSIEMNFTLRD